MRTLALLVMLFLTACGKEPAFVPYVPKTYDPSTEKFVDAPALLTPTHLADFERILSRYGEPFQKDAKQGILISRTLAENDDLLWNYTTKAEEESAGNMMRR